MIKRIGWRDCNIRIVGHKKHLAFAKLANELARLKEISEVSFDLVKLCLQNQDLPGVLFHLGFQTTLKTGGWGMERYISPRDNCAIKTEEIVLPALASVIQKGSAITFILSDGSLVRYSFDGQNCIIETGEITFPSDKRYVLLKGIFDGYYRGPAAIVIGSYNHLKDASAAFCNETRVERAMLQTGKYPADIEVIEDEDSLLWVASEKKNGMHWPVIQISVQTVDGIVTPFENETEEE